MTKSKRKLLVSMIVIAFVILVALSVVTIAFALAQQTITTTLNISYTTKDIDGSVKVEYALGETAEYEVLKPTAGANNLSEDGNELVFHATDTTSAGSYQFPTGLSLSSTNRCLRIKYTYKNTGARHYVAKLLPRVNLDNMVIKYSTDGTNYSTDEYALVLKGRESATAQADSRSYYIKISIDNMSKNANFSGAFDWELNEQDPSKLGAETYLSLADLQFQSNGSGAYNVSISDSDTGYVGGVVFPSEIEGTPVTAIVQNSNLTKKDQITSVYIPDSITQIGDYAFSGYTNLQSVRFEQNVSASGVKAQSSTGLKTIGAYAFNNCSRLTELNIPTGLTSFKMSAYNGCSSLTTIMVPACVTSNVNFSWNNLESLTGITFEGNVSKVVLRLTANQADSTGHINQTDVNVNVTSNNAEANLTAIKNAVLDGYSACISSVVYIVSDSVSIKFNGNDITTGKIVGNSIQLTSVVTPDDATVKDVNWSITNGSNIASVSSSGLVTFTSYGNVTVRATTKDSGKTDDVTITRIAPEIKLYDNTSTLISSSAQTTVKTVVIPAGQNSVSVSVDLDKSGLLDPENVNIDNVTATVTSTDSGLTVTPTRNTQNKNYYTITRGSIIQKRAATIQFSYGSKNVSIKTEYRYLQSITSVLKDDDDKNCGLEGKRVWATKTYDSSSSTGYTNQFSTKFNLYPANSQDQIYTSVICSDDNWGSFEKSQSNGEINIKLKPYPFDASLADRVVTVKVWADGVDPVQYSYTFLAGGYANVSDNTGFSWACSEGYAIVLQSTLNINDCTSFPKIYGNGHTLNFSEYIDAKFTFGDVRNVTIKCANDNNKANEVALCGNTEYCRIQNMGKAWSSPGSGRSIKITNTIFQNSSQCGLQIGDETAGSVYLENTIFDNVGQTAVDFQNGNLYIKGIFDVYNFRKYTEFSSLSQSTIKSFYQDSSFQEYIYKENESDVATWKANIAIAMTPTSLTSTSVKSTNVYFHKSGTTYELLSSSTDTTTGLGYKQISYTKGTLIKTQVYLITPTIAGSYIKHNSTLTTEGESKIYGANKLAYYNAHK